MLALRAMISHVSMVLGKDVAAARFQECLLSIPKCVLLFGRPHRLPGVASWHIGTLPKSWQGQCFLQSFFLSDTHVTSCHPVKPSNALHTDRSIK